METTMPNRPLFSILHSSARPDKWRAVYDDWMSKATHPEDVEYVLCADERWGFVPGEVPQWVRIADRFGRNLLVWNEARRCYVDGVNTAAKASTGRILIVNADDQFACEGWDVAIRNSLAVRLETVEVARITLLGDGEAAECQSFATWRFAISVSTGTPQEHERGIMVMPILSRARYESLGYVFFPEYESMFADNDFCEHAKQDGILIEARHLMFPHRHPMFDPTVEADEAYAVQNRRESYGLGEHLLMRRRASHFGREPLPELKVLALCLAGEMVSLNWALATIGTLRAELQQRGWTVVTHTAYTSNVYVTRMLNAKSVIESVEQGVPRPDYVLWIDDDNLVTIAHVEQLVEDLEAMPDVDLAAGWCWICSEHDNVIRVSCGNFSPDCVHLTHFDNEVWAKSRTVRPIEWTGFPCVLMRYSLLAEMGPEGFTPIVDKRLQFGVAGEDTSFCQRAGLHKMIADPRVKVQHVKPRAIEPRSEVYKTPKVAAMLRVHNEARWIKRVIESLRELCGDRIFVLDDESTDDTRHLARLAGARVYADPFDGQPLDEGRDKNWLTQAVISECDPDWILCVDGDEELEPLGAEKIMATLRSPQFDCYGLRFLTLWDRPDQVRVDRWYGNFARQGLFRASVAQEWKCAYEGCGTHAGLHVSNAPAGMQWAVISAYLIHYGYMFKEDRIRKYEYYNGIDPNNEIEDRYRHIVQGDIPEVPAEAELKHAGPLELRKLPASIAPKFEMPVAPIRAAPLESFTPGLLSLSHRYWQRDEDGRDFCGICGRGQADDRHVGEPIGTKKKELSHAEN